MSNSGAKKDKALQSAQCVDEGDPSSLEKSDGSEESSCSDEDDSLEEEDLDLDLNGRVRSGN